MNKKRIVLAGSLIVLFVAVGVFARTAWAKAQEIQTVANLETTMLAGSQLDGQDFQPKIQRMMKRLGAYLDLTEEQKTQIKTIIETERPKVQPIAVRTLATRKALLEATGAGQFDESQVKLLADQQGKNLAALIVEKERVKSQIYTVLTPEQREKVEQLRNRIESKIRQHFAQ